MRRPGSGSLGCALRAALGMTLLVVLLLGHAAAQTVNVDSSMSQGTIQADIDAAGTGATINFAAGSGGGYSLTSPLSIPCGDTFAGPAATPPTAILSIAGGSSAISNGGCADITIEYLGFVGGGGGAYLYNDSNVTFEHNDCSGIVAGQGNQTSMQCLALDGSSTEPSLNGLTYEYNYFHDSCSTVDDVTTDQGGLCNALFITYGGSNATIEYNRVGGSTGVEEGFKSLQNNTTLSNVTIRWNDFQDVHRLAIEFQNLSPVGVLVDSNTFSNWFNPYAVTGPISVPMWYPTTATSGQVAVTNNVMVTGAQTPTGQWFYAIEEGGPGFTAQNNVIQGTWTNGIACYNSANAVITDNTLEGTFPSGAAISEEEGAGTCPGWTTTPNTTGSSTAALTSVKPTISPATEAASGPVTVTLADSGYNTSIYYTTDGSTPTVNSTRYTGPFSVTPTSAGATVKAIGMWGTPPNTTAWPSTQGYVPSGTASATYTLSGGPTLTSMYLAAPGNQNTLALTQKLQFTAWCVYSDGFADPCSTRDARGNAVTSWASSATGALPISATGVITASATGTANITASIYGVTSSPWGVTAVAGTQLTGCRTISAAGNYVLANDITAPGTCFTVTAPSGTVVIALNGHTLTYGTASTISSVTAQAVTHGTGNSTDPIPGLVGTVDPTMSTNEGPAQAIVNVTRIANSSGGANAYTYSTSNSGSNANCQFGHGFCQGMALNWNSSPPANGATYYVDFTKNTPVFGIVDTNPTANTLNVFGPGSIVEGAGAYGWSDAIYFSNQYASGFSTSPDIEQVSFRMHGRASQAVGVSYGGAGIILANNSMGTTSQNQYIRDYFTGSAMYLNSAGSNSTVVAAQPIMGNTIDSAEQNGFMSVIGYQTISGNTVAATSNASNDYAFEVYGDHSILSGNAVMSGANARGSGRGIDIEGIDTDIGFEDIDVKNLPTNIEYGGCALDGAVGVRFFDSNLSTGGALTNANLHDSILTTHASPEYQGANSGCPAIGIDWVSYEAYGSDSTTNAAKNVVINVDCDNACTWNTPSEGLPNGGAAAVNFVTYSNAQMRNLTINTDNVAFFTQNNGGENNICIDCAINNPHSAADFFVFAAWPSTDSGLPSGSTASVTLQDPVLGAGVNPQTQYMVNVTGVNYFYEVTNTYTVSARNTSANAAVAGATVTLTDALSNHYTGTTDASGTASIVVPQYERNWNAAGSIVGVLTTYTPYTAAIAAPGCTTLNYTPASITGPHVTESKQLPSC